MMRASALRFPTRVPDVIRKQTQSKSSSLPFTGETTCVRLKFGSGTLSHVLVLFSFTVITSHMSK